MQLCTEIITLMKYVAAYLYTYSVFNFGTFYTRMVTLVKNIYISYTLYINTCSIMWCYSEHSAQINELVL